MNGGKNVDYKKTKNKHCCETLKYWIADKDNPFYYNSKYRSYGMTVPKQLLRRNEVCNRYLFTFCPRCGTKFSSIKS